MKSLHLLKTSTGASWALRQIRELITLGVDVHVALPCNGPMVGKYAEVGAIEHLLQTDFPLRSPWKFPALASDFKKLVHSIMPDIIHSHFVGTTLSMRLVLGRGKTIPRVFQVPGPLHLEHFFFRKTELMSAGKSDFWMGSCQWTCDCYQSLGVNADRIGLAYYGTDVDSFVIEKKGALRRELGLKENTKIVGMVAYFYAPKKYLGQDRGLKGHEDLIDAFALCLEKHLDMCCVIAGGAWGNAEWYEKHVKQYAQEKCGDKVIFLGTRNDVPKLYPDFDVAVHPSLSENVGGAVESLMSGVPTIATNVGGFPDLVKDGETGWLIPSKSPVDLAAAILDAVENPDEAKRRAVKGQKLARDLFDVRFNARQVLSFYEKVLAHSSGKVS